MKLRGTIFSAVLMAVFLKPFWLPALPAEDMPELDRQFSLNHDKNLFAVFENDLCDFSILQVHNQPLVSMFSEYQQQDITECVDDEWQVLPSGLMYQSYLAGEKEARFQFRPMIDTHGGAIAETALGGRVGLLRYGTHESVAPEGWQLDVEGAVFARLDLQQEWDLQAADFRAGLLSTWREGPNAFKAGYYHISSHVGDEFLVTNPGYIRRNYVRDSLIAGWTHDVTLNTQAYAEIGYAFNYDGGALPLELQFGAQYSPACATGLRGAPFAALNFHVREDYNFATGVNVAAGWQWRGAESDHRFRAGLQCYDGPSLQYSFGDQHETLVGGGIWLDY